MIELTVKQLSTRFPPIYKEVACKLDLMSHELDLLTRYRAYLPQSNGHKDAMTEAFVDFTQFWVNVVDYLRKNVRGDHRHSMYPGAHKLIGCV
jgi:hypothetical protein